MCNIRMRIPARRSSRMCMTWCCLTFVKISSHIHTLGFTQFILAAVEGRTFFEMYNLQKNSRVIRLGSFLFGDLKS